MKHAATRELFAYWNGLRGARTAPERCDIDPIAIRAILADTFTLDVRERFPLRLTGTRAGALLAAGRGGDSFLDCWRPEERHNLAAVLFAVADRASPIVVGAAAVSPDRPECALELLFLPLRHFGKTHARILGIVTAARPSTHQPSWPGVMPTEALAIRSLRIIAEDEMAQVAARPDASEATPLPLHDAVRSPVSKGSGTPGLGQPLPGRPILGRPALRLIEGGRPS